MSMAILTVHIQGKNVYNFPAQHTLISIQPLVLPAFTDSDYKTVYTRKQKDSPIITFHLSAYLDI